MTYQYDRIVHTLYLAKSTRREEMLTNLVENLLFSYTFPLGLSDIKDLIRDDIGFVPIELELRTSLDNAVENGSIHVKEGRFSLSDESRGRISLALAEGNEVEIRRFENFKDQCPTFLDIAISASDAEKLWKTYNEYIVKCFLEFGKKAMEIFLPNSPFNDLRSNGFLNDALKQLDQDALKEAFRKIVQEYPDRLNSAEIKHLNSLAIRAEKVFSLGLPKEELEKIENLNFKDTVVFADTNFLYQVLGLNYHPEDDAVQQIIELARKKIIDIKLSFFSRTLRELNTAKDDLERRIPRQNLNPSHIRLLLKSPDLDDFSRRYYEEKLRDSDTVHPSVRVTHALDNLRSKGLEVYRVKFQALDEDEENKLLNAKVTQYYDWVRHRNEQRQTKGIAEMRQKSDKQIEHDVYLREAMLQLTRKAKSEYEIKYLCLTLDRRLIEFDSYESRRSILGQAGMVTPLFMSPSVFLSKIRPFLPIQTEDYQKAFVKALTCATADTGDARRSELLQRSFTYFSKQGIDDEGAIGNIIRRDLFLTEFEEKEAKGEAQDFIESELNHELERMRLAAQEAEKLLDEMQNRFDRAQRQNTEDLQKFETKVDEKNDQLAEKNSHISSLEDRMVSMQLQLEAQRESNDKAQLNSTYYRELPAYQAKRWAEFIKEYKKGRKFIFKFSAWHILPIALAFALTQGDYVKNWLSEHQISGNVLLVVIFALTVVSAGGLLIYRTLLVDKPEKELSRLTWNYFWGDKDEIKMAKYQEYKKEFDSENPNLVKATGDIKSINA